MRYKYRAHGYDELLVRTIRAMYYACISFVDYHIGRILAGLGQYARPISVPGRDAESWLTDEVDG